MTAHLKDFYQGKTVLVTGHTGFKGGWLAVWLKLLGARVIGFALPPDTEPNFFSVAGVAGDEVEHGRLEYEEPSIDPALA